MCQAPAPEPGGSASASPAPPVWSIRRRHVIAAVVLVLVAAAAVWIVATQFAAADTRLRQTREAVEKRDFGRACGILAEYLADHPDDAEARLLLARTARRNDEFALADRELGTLRKKQVLKDRVQLEYRLMRLQNGDLAESGDLLALAANDSGPETPWILEAYILGHLRQFAPPAGDGPGDGRNPPSPAGGGCRREGRRSLAAVADRFSRPGGRADLAGTASRFGRRLRGVGRRLSRRGRVGSRAYDARHYYAKSIASQNPRESLAQLLFLRERLPDNVHVAFAAATLLHSQNRLREAYAALIDLLQRNPRDAMVLTELGLVCMSEGKFEEAQQHLEQALRIEAKDARAHEAMSRCLRALGKTEDAKRHFDIFLRLEAGRN